MHLLFNLVHKKVFSLNYQNFEMGQKVNGRLFLCVDFVKVQGQHAFLNPPLHGFSARERNCNDPKKHGTAGYPCR